MTNQHVDVTDSRPMNYAAILKAERRIFFTGRFTQKCSLLYWGTRAFWSLWQAFLVAPSENQRTILANISAIANEQAALAQAALEKLRADPMVEAENKLRELDRSRPEYHEIFPDVQNLMMRKGR